MWQRPPNHTAGDTRPVGFKPAARFARRRPASAPARARGRRLIVEREKMLHDTRITEKHSTAAILSNQPRWGLSTELGWRERHAGQHVRSAWRLPGSAGASSSRPASAADRSGAGSKSGEADRSDYFARLSAAGAYTLTGEQLKLHQKERIFSVVRRALEEKRSLYGATVHDTVSFFAAADTDSSGTLDRFEFRRAMRRLGVGLSPAQVEQLVQAVDSDRSGEVSYAEFLDAVLAPEPEQEPEAEAAVDAAASMLRSVESSSSGWEHERPWPEALCPAPDAPIDTVRIVAVDGSVLHERRAANPCELSREEKNYRAKNAKRLAGVDPRGGPSVIQLRVVYRAGTNEFGVESAAQGKCYTGQTETPTAVWRLEISGASSPGISTRRADGSRPPRMVVREMVKMQGWCWNKMGRCWYRDFQEEELARESSSKLRLLCERENLSFQEVEQ